MGKVNFLKKAFDFATGKKPSRTDIENFLLHAGRKETAALQALLDKFNPAYFDLCSAFFGAVADGDIKMAALLLDRGADIEERDGVFRTPLMRAALQASRPMMEFLVGRGADISIMNPAGDGLLAYAVASGDMDKIEYALSLGLDARAKNTDGKTSLFFATSKNIFQRLKQEGADVNTPANNGQTVLMNLIQASESFPNINVYAAEIDFLISLTVNIEAACAWGGPAGRVPVKGTTALMVAAECGVPEAVRSLLRSGADPGAKNEHGQTALDIARYFREIKGHRAPHYDDSMKTLAEEMETRKARALDAALKPFTEGLEKGLELCAVISLRKKPSPQ